MAHIHEYKVEVSWTGGLQGAGSSKSAGSGHQATISVPKEFNGPGAGTNPEELLASAIGSCYSITFGIIAANRKLDYASIVTETVGEVEQNGPQYTYKKITLRPTITLNPGAPDEAVALAEDIAHKSDMYCIITRAVKGNVEIVVEPNVVRS